MDKLSQTGILEELDYSPFGTVMVGRNWSAEYRFGFNGYENTDEIIGDHIAIDFGARIYDVRIGRFFSIDPKSLEYPWQSTYAYYSNNPILIKDIDGMGGPKEYKVQGGDSPESIAAANGISVWDLANANQGSQEQGGKFNSTEGKDYDDYWIQGKGTEWKLNKGDVLIIPESGTDSKIGNVTNQVKPALVLSGTSTQTETNSQNSEALDNIEGFLSLTVDAVEELGGLDKASKLIEEGKFETIYNGEAKTWSLKFNGNQYVDAQFVAAEKTAFMASAAKGTTVLKVVHAGGVILNVAGILITAYNISQEGFTTENSIDLIVGGIAFIPGGGWIVAGAYFGFKFIYQNGELTPEQKSIRASFLNENNNEIPTFNISEKFEP